MKSSGWTIAACAALLIFSAADIRAQRLVRHRLPDTGQRERYSGTHREDGDVIVNAMSFTDNLDGTVTDNVTGLMWQKADGGEMIFENAGAYSAGLSLGGYADWRLPTCRELMGINRYDRVNPALDTAIFTKTLAEYWWTSERRADDSTRVWVVNAGGGIGAHPKSETVSAGGIRRIHVRAVRDPISTEFPGGQFTDRGDGTVRDNWTGLIWQQAPSAGTVTWEEALAFAAALSLGGRTDWRVPNVKELQSLTDPAFVQPAVSGSLFAGLSGNLWSSTTLVQNTARAWEMSTDYGLVSYADKTTGEQLLCVCGGTDNIDFGFREAVIPLGSFVMGDHFGYVDPRHPSDELPMHTISVDSFRMAITTTTTAHFAAFLNASLIAGQVEVRNNAVYALGDTLLYCYTHGYAPYYSIGYDGKSFSVADFRSQHPVVGVQWFGAIAFANWLSAQNGLAPCYTVSTGTCDFAASGYRLPTEAEWEYAGRGGNTNPYTIYPWGDLPDASKANWPGSKDPYEGTGESSYPWTTPVGFYDGTLRAKSDFNWPATASSYQTADGANGFGLYDMAGNVWQFVNDWYGQNYYSASPADNPKGPDSGFIMPDGKPYRGMRGGNWYNGDLVNGVDDGHSRVSNRNPSYYRGPLDPNHPWYHIGFRVARTFKPSVSSVHAAERVLPSELSLLNNYPNPFNPATTIRFAIGTAGALSTGAAGQGAHVRLSVFDILGREVALLADGVMEPGWHSVTWNAAGMASGVYVCRLQAGIRSQSIRMLLVR
jgi:formylglycine-generating enzyme required for sulfatase activity